MKPRTLATNKKLHLRRSAVAHSLGPPRLCGELPASSTRSITPVTLRPYQQAAFDNRTNGIELWLWGRQTGKSFTLAAWTIDRLITRPGRLVTILSNGAELNQKCAEVSRLYQRAFEQHDLSPAPQFECMSYETRITISGQTSRINAWKPVISGQSHHRTPNPDQCRPENVRATQRWVARASRLHLRASRANLRQNHDANSEEAS
jgi:hypothetical protein